VVSAREGHYIQILHEEVESIEGEGEEPRRTHTSICSTLTSVLEAPHQLEQTIEGQRKVLQQSARTGLLTPRHRCSVQTKAGTRVLYPCQSHEGVEIEKKLKFRKPSPAAYCIRRSSRDTGIGASLTSGRYF